MEFKGNIQFLKIYFGDYNLFKQVGETSIYYFFFFNVEQIFSLLSLNNYDPSFISL